MTHPDELERLARAATPGDRFWARDASNQATSLMTSGAGEYVLSPQADVGDYGLSVNPYNDAEEADLAFIAAANPATILALLSANREMREAVSVLNAALNRIAAANPGSTNSETAKDMAEWSHCVAVVALCDASVVKARSALTTQRGDGE